MDLSGWLRWPELLHLVQHGQPDLIVVWRLDRAFRSVLDGATTLGLLRAWGCALRSLQEPWIDTMAPIGEATFHITIAWAGLEKRTLSESTRAGMERAREASDSGVRSTLRATQNPRQSGRCVGTPPTRSSDV